MNIDQYRALKAAEATQQTEQTNQTATQQTEQSQVTQPPATPATPPEVKQEQQVTPPVVDKVVVDGEELTLEQIKEFKAGYSRTQDYTRKTQEAAKIKREAQEALELINRVRTNPQLSEQLGVKQVDDASLRQRELEDQLVQREVELMSAKYQDFDVKEALELASTKPGLNLEDAHFLLKSRKQQVPPVQTQQPVLDIEEIRKQITQEILKQFETTQSATTSIISSNDGATPVKPAGEVELTQAELEYCRKTRTDPEQYKKDKEFLIKSRKR